MRNFILLASAATMANMFAVMLVLAQPGTATSRMPVSPKPDSVSSMPSGPVQTLRPLF
jgi:hypothetical protein